MKNFFKPSVVATALLGTAFAITHLGAHAETTLERVQRTGEIRIGYANERPFAYTLPDGRVTGEDLRVGDPVRPLGGHPNEVAHDGAGDVRESGGIPLHRRRDEVVDPFL